MLGQSTPTKAMAAEDMAQAALFLASDLSAGVNGHILAVDGGAPQPEARVAVMPDRFGLLTVSPAHNMAWQA